MTMNSSPVPEATNVTVIPATRPPTPIETLKVALEKDLRKQVINYYSGREEEALRFMTAAVDYVRRVPKLLECNQTSLLTAMIACAQFRFMPSGVSGEAYLIPYGAEAKFQIGYQGIVTLLYRTEKITGITANIVYQNDDFEYQEGLEPILKHKPRGLNSVKGEPIGVYTVAQMRGGKPTFKVMSRDEVMEIKDLSKAKGSKDSPWNSDKDPFLWMWKKTCLIQHAKLLPKTQELQRAIAVDHEGEGIEKPQFDAAGPAVGRAFHDPASSGPETKE